MNVRKFKTEYKELKSVLSAARSGRLTFDKIVQAYGDRYKSMEDFVNDITENIRKYEASVCIFYNSDRTVNTREFDKFHSRFVRASAEEKRLFETVNNTTYEKLSEELNGIKNMIDEYRDEDDKEYREIKKGLAQIKKGLEDRIKMKKELVELGIAEDDGPDGVIHIIPERFVDYLKYMENRHS